MWAPTLALIIIEWATEHCHTKGQYHNLVLLNLWFRYTFSIKKKKDTDNDISFNDFNKVNLPKCFKLMSFFIRCASMNTITRNIVMQVNLVNK